MFIWRVDVFLAELARQQPALHDGLQRIAAAWDTPQRAAVLADAWPALPRIAVDYAVMEGAAARGRVATVPGDFGWNDIGDFRTLSDLLPADENGNVLIAGDVPAELAAVNGAGHEHVLVRDSTGSVVIASGSRLVSTLGLKDVIVVDTPDALLVCARDRAQDVKQIADAVRRHGGPS
jgi:mannose-1-phosphate guanylyltransferase